MLDYSPGQTIPDGRIPDLGANTRGTWMTLEDLPALAEQGFLIAQTRCGPCRDSHATGSYVRAVGLHEPKPFNDLVAAVAFEGYWLSAALAYDLLMQRQG